MEDTVVERFDNYNEMDRLAYDRWERLLSSGEVPEYHRPIISASWQRCLSNKIDPMRKAADLIYSGSDLKEQKKRNQLLLKIVSPYIDELFNDIADQPMLVILADPRGIIIEGRANTKTWSKVENIRFVPGADWSEEAAGTNAIGTAIAEGKPIQVFAAEHFCQGWHPWICSAAPIRDPLTKQLLGVLDLTGEKNLVQAHCLHLVTNLVRKIERDISSRVLEQNLSMFQDVVNVMREPFVTFNSKGVVTRCNKQAQYFLQLQPGKSITGLIHSEFLRFLADSHREIQVSVRSKGQKEWVAYLYPYRIGDSFLGGLAVFQETVLSPPRVNLPQKRSTRYRFDHIIVQDPKMKRLIDMAHKAANSDKTLLITGETGVGKEMLAQSIHNGSTRSEGPFISVNCGAIPHDLLASELFGYAPGAFTGALSKGKKGKFVLADKGTLFLDEIGEMPPEAQVYLLRALEERVVVPVGGTEGISVDVRVIAATHRDLAREVERGKFREDLYYRINVIHLHIPPLRERKQDIPLLVRHFLANHDEKPSVSIDSEAIDCLMQYDWPGNIRQLKNVIDKAVFYDQDGCISLDDLPEEVKKRGTFYVFLSGSKEGRASGNKLNKRSITKEMLTQTLALTNRNIAKTARLLHVSRTTIYRKIREFGLDEG